MELGFLNRMDQRVGIPVCTMTSLKPVTWNQGFQPFGGMFGNKEDVRGRRSSNEMGQTYRPFIPQFHCGARSS